MAASGWVCVRTDNHARIPLHLGNQTIGARELNLDSKVTRTSLRITAEHQQGGVPKLHVTKTGGSVVYHIERSGKRKVLDADTTISASVDTTIQIAKKRIEVRFERTVDLGEHEISGCDCLERSSSPMSTPGRGKSSHLFTPRTRPVAGGAGTSVHPHDSDALGQLKHLRDSYVKQDFPLLEGPSQKDATERESLVEFMAEVRPASTPSPPPRPSAHARPRASCPPQLCEEFGLQTQTAGLAVSYYDRHLAKKTLRKERSPDGELTSKACVLLASKFLESKVPAISDLCTVSERMHTREGLKEAEQEVLKELDWEMYVTTPHAFLELLREILRILDEPGSAFVMRAEFMVDMSYYE